MTTRNPKKHPIRSLDTRITIVRGFKRMLRTNYERAKTEYWPQQRLDAANCKSLSGGHWDRITSYCQAEILGYREALHDMFLETVVEQRYFIHNNYWLPREIGRALGSPQLNSPEIRVENLHYVYVSSGPNFKRFS